MTIRKGFSPSEFAITPGSRSYDQDSPSYSSNPRSSDVTIVQTRIQRLSLISAPDLLYPQTGLRIARKIQESSGTVAAVSLELDSHLQPIIDRLFQEQKKVHAQEFPCIGFTMDYCIRNRIPLHAVDRLQLVYLRTVEELHKHRAKEPSDKTSREKISELRHYLQEIEEQRAKETAAEISILLPHVNGNLVHIATKRQTEKLEQLIS